MAELNHKSQLASGARGIIRITDSNGVTTTLGMALDISVNIRETVRETYVMGELNPVALDPTAIDVDCSIGRVIPVMTQAQAKQPNTATATRTSGTGTSGTGTTPTHATEFGAEIAIDSILTAPAIDIELFDTVSAQSIARIRQARFTGRTLSTSTSEIANERLNFVGIYDSSNDNTATVGYGV